MITNEQDEHPGIQGRQHTKTEYPPTSPASLLSWQDRVIFGTLNRDLADELAKRIEAAICKGVNSLPLLEEGQAKSFLTNTLMHKFLRNIDVLEAYCAHHVLTVRKFPLEKRKRVEQVSRYGSSVLDEISHIEQCKITNSSNVNTDGNIVRDDLTSRIPSQSNSVPSDRENISVQRQLSYLREELKNARNDRMELQVQQVSLHDAEMIANKIEIELTSNHATFANLTVLEKQNYQETDSDSAMQKQVTRVVSDGFTVHELTREAQAILSNLDRKRRERGKNSTEHTEEGDDDPFYKNFMPSVKKPRMSPEEAYHRHKEQLGLFVDTTNRDSAKHPNSTLRAIKDILATKQTNSLTSS